MLLKGEVTVQEDLVLSWTVFHLPCGSDSSPLSDEEQGSSLLSVTCFMSSVGLALDLK